MRESENRDFIEALARGLDVLASFDSAHQRFTLSELSERVGLARPTVRRILITLDEMGYVRTDAGSFSLTPRVLEFGMAYLSSTHIWELAKPRLADLSTATGESCSIAQLDGSDIVYVARVAVPKLVTLSVSVGTRFPALPTSLGKVLLASLPEEDLRRALAEPSRSGVTPTWRPDESESISILRRVREQGWAISDQQLAPAIRSIAAPITNEAGEVVAAVNINAHAAETSVETLTHEFLPLLLKSAEEISRDYVLWESVPLVGRA